ncbi:hypothetical protein Drorol1_Dr00017794 [Drosera rotundifolia]
MHSRLPALEKALFDYRERQEVSKRQSERCHKIDFRYRADTGFFDPTDEVYMGAGNAPTPTNAGTKTGGNETSSKGFLNYVFPLLRVGTKSVVDDIGLIEDLEDFARDEMNACEQRIAALKAEVVKEEKRLEGLIGKVSRAEAYY